MSLQVWLPLTGDLHNQGLSDLSFSIISDTNTTIDNDGKIGKCYSNDSHTAGGLISDEVIELGQQQSMFCWFKFTDLHSGASLGGSLISQHRTSTYTGMGITIRYVSATTGYLSVSTGNGSSRTYNTYYGTTLLQANTWYHGGYTYDGSTIKIYVNGICEKTQAFSGMSVPADYISCFCWNLTGTSGNTIQANYKLQGSLNDVRIYDHCLSEMEVKKLAQGLVVHYLLNRGGWGQENLYGYGADLQTTLSGLNNYNNSFSIIEEEGKKCAHVSGALTTTKYLQSKATFTPEPMEQFTFSAEVKIKNIVRGTTNPMCEFYFSGATIDSAWRGFAVDYIHVDGVKVGATVIGFDRYLTDTAWHKVAVTAHFNYSGTSTIPALYPNIYMRDCTGDLYIRNVKLERGSIATPWCPNSADMEESFIEYDCSGFCNNGTRIGTFEWSSNTPKYSVSTYFGIYNTPHIDMLDNNLLSSLTEGSVAWWEYCTTTGNTLLFTGQSGSYYIGAGSATTRLYDSHIGDSGIILYKDGVAQSTTQGTSVYHPNVFHTQNQWHHFVITGVNLSEWTKFKINSYGSNWPLNAYVSDVRIYATALSAEDVKSLYQNCATIAADGTIYGQIYS